MMGKILELYIKCLEIKKIYLSKYFHFFNYNEIDDLYKNICIY